jgi:WD40 repeat protein
MKHRVLSVLGLALFLCPTAGFAAAPVNARELATLRGHTSGATGVSFSPNGQRLVAGSVDGGVRVWDLTSERALFTVSAQHNPIWSVAFSPDGRYFLTGGGGGRNSADLWDAESGVLLRTFPPGVGTDWVDSGPLRKPREGNSGAIEVVAFSPDGKQLLSGGDGGSVLIWDTATGDSRLLLGQRGGASVHAAAFAPDGLTIAIGTYSGKLGLWKAQGGQEVRELAGHTNAIEFLAWFPDGGRIVTASYDKTARIWDVKTGREALVFRGHQGEVTCVAVSPDGRWVVTGSMDQSGKVWDARTGEVQFLLQGHKAPLDGVAFSPDGTKIATTSFDQTVKIWKIAPGAKPIATVSEFAFRLESGYIPLGIRFRADPSRGEIRSIRVAGTAAPKGNGSADIWLDTRLAELNNFGDVVRRIGHEPAATRVQLRYVATGTNVPGKAGLPSAQSRASQGLRLYDLVFPDGALRNCLQLVLGRTSVGPHRLLVRAGATFNGQPRPDIMTHLLVLEGTPALTSVLPDAPLKGRIELFGDYTALAGRIQSLRVRGIPGGAGTVAFDPNQISFDPFGSAMMITAMGYPHHEITFKSDGVVDPLGQGRKLYWAVSKDPKNTNRVAVVLSPTEAGPHRVLVYQGDKLAFIVPAHLADRLRREINASELGLLSAGEQQAITDLRAVIGQGFPHAVFIGSVRRDRAGS